MATGQLVFGGIGAALALIGVALLRGGVIRRQRAKRTQNTTEKAIADVSPSDDRVSVTGTVENPDGTVDAHLASDGGAVVQTEAATYNEKSTSDNDATGINTGGVGRGSYQWRQSDVRATAFDVTDDTGTVRVTPDGDVDAVIDEDEVVDVQDTDNPIPAVSDAVDAADDIILSNHTDRMREGAVGAGDEVTVQGHPQNGGDGLALGSGGAPLLVTDGTPEEASDEQAEGWLGRVLVGALFVALGVGALALLLG